MAMVSLDQIKKLVTGNAILGAALNDGSIQVVYKWPPKVDADLLFTTWTIEVLVVDDDVTDMVRAALERLGFDLVQTANTIKATKDSPITGAMRTALQREEEKENKAKITQKAAAKEAQQAETIGDLQGQIDELREDAELRNLIKPKTGKQGKQGKPGRDGVDGKDLEASSVDLAELRDVDAANVSQGQVLIWQEISGTWEPRFPPQIANISGGGGGGGGGGGSALELRQVQGVDGPVDLAVSDVTTILFDNSTGFFLTDKGDGEVFIELGSSFKTWFIDGQTTLVAAGEDEIELVAGQNIELVSTDTHTGATAKAITISGTGPGEAPLDGSAYVRMSGQWQPAAAFSYAELEAKVTTLEAQLVAMTEQFARISPVVLDVSAVMSESDSIEQARERFALLVMETLVTEGADENGDPIVVLPD